MDLEPNPVLICLWAEQAQFSDSFAINIDIICTNTYNHLGLAA